MLSKEISGYRVFTNGSVQGKFGKMLKPRIDGCGYHRIVFSDGPENQVQKSVHRLVAELFIPNPYDKPEVNHLDRDKSNNSISNLEWATRAENNKHAPSQKGRKGNLSHSSKPVLHLPTGIFYDSIKDASECFSIPYKNLSIGIIRRNKKYLNFAV